MKKLRISVIILFVSLTLGVLCSPVYADSPVTMNVNYSIVGDGSGYSAPIFHYTDSHGDPANWTLTTTPTPLTLFSPSSWSVIPTSLTGSSASERWYSGETSSGTASSATITFTFFHQYKATASYSTSDGSTPSPNVVLSGTSLGGASSTTLATSTTQVWLDAGTGWSVNNPITAGSGTERWDAASGASGTVTEAITIAPSYYHQYTITFGYSTSDSSHIANTLVIGSYYQFGSTQSITSDGTGAVSPASTWVDAGTSKVSYQTVTAGSGNERWALSSSPDNKYVASSATLSETGYYHQYLVVLQYTVYGGSPTAPTSYYTQFNVALTKSAATGTSVSDWVNAGTAVSYTNPLGGSGVSERWQTNLAISGGKSTVAASVGSGTSPINPTYHHQYQVTFQYSVANTPAGTPTDPTATYTKFGTSGTTSTVKQSSPPNDWVDAGSNVTYTNPITSGVSERWKISPESSANPYVADSSVAASETLNPTYHHQYKATASYSTSDGSTPSASVTLSGTQFGSTNYTLTLTLTTSAQTPWLDAGTGWSVNNPITAGSGTERWDAASGASGTVTEAITIAPSYYHQYKATFSQSGVSSDFAGTVVTIDGTDNLGVSGFSTSYWWNNGSSHTFSFQSPLTVSGKRYVWTSNSGLSTSQSNTLTISGSGNVTGTYKIQYLVTFAQSGLSSDASGTVVTVFGDAKSYGQLSNSTWVDSGDSVTFSYTATISSSVSSKQYVLTGASATSPLTVSAATTVTGSYTTPYFITVTSAHGSPTKASQWVNAGSTFTVSVTNPDMAGTGHQWNLTGLTLDGVTQALSNSLSLTNVQAIHTIIFSWTEQYFITASAGANGSISPSGSVPVNAGTIQTFTITPTSDYHISNVVVDGVPQGAITQYNFTNVVTNHTISATFAANASGSFSITFTASGLPTGTSWSVTLGTTTLTSTTNTITFSGLSSGTYAWITATQISGATGTRYVASSSSGDASSVTPVTITYNTQYLFTVTSDHGIATGADWYNSGTSAKATLDAGTVAGTTGIQYVFTSWSGDASGTGLTSSAIAMDSAKTATANWVTQYQTNAQNLTTVTETNSTNTQSTPTVTTQTTSTTTPQTTANNTNLYPLATALVLIALAGLAIYLLRKRPKRKSTADAPKPTPALPPPSVAQKLPASIRAVRCFLLLFQRKTGKARFPSVLSVPVSALSIILVHLRYLPA